MYSEAYDHCLQSIIITQLMKSILLATVEFINHFYTWGTGLPVFNSSMYLVLEIAILLDFLYYLLPRLNSAIPQLQPKLINGKQKTTKILRSGISLEGVILEIISGMVVGTFIALIPIYSMTEPSSDIGTVEPK